MPLLDPQMNVTIREGTPGGDAWDQFPDAPAPSAQPRAASPYADAIAGIESGGRYDLLGPVTRTGDRAYGKYQVMGQNIPTWTEQVLGQRLTPQQFLSSKEAQDAVFNAKFGEYEQKYGPGGAARAWFAGERGMHDPNRRDILGTSVQSYEDKFNRATGLPSSAAPAQATGFAPEEPPPQGFFNQAQGKGPPAMTPRGAAPNWWDQFPDAKSPNAKQSGAEPTTSFGQAFGRGALQGATFNFGDELEGLIAAGREGPRGEGLRNPAGALADLIKGGYNYWRDDPAAVEKYNAEVARQRGLSETAQKERPGATLAGNVVGAVSTPVGRLTAAPTIGGRIVRSAGVGAAYGGLAGAGEGTTPEGRAVGAATGAAVGAPLGAAAPPVTEAVLRAPAYLGKKYFDYGRGIFRPTQEAERRIAVHHGRDVAMEPDVPGGRPPRSRMTDQEVDAAAAEGMPVSNLERGGVSVRALAKSAADTSPDARGVIERFVGERFEGQSYRLVDWLQRKYHYPDATAQREAIEEVARTTNRRNYQLAYRHGDRPINSPELETLGSSPHVVAAMKKAAEEGKTRAVAEGSGAFNPGVRVTDDGRVMFRTGQSGVPTYPNLQFWDYTYRNLRDAGRKLTQDGDSTGRDVTNLAKRMAADLDKQVSGYKEARAGAAHYFDAEDMLEAGQKFLMQPKSNLHDARRKLAQASDTEKQLFRDGFMTEYIDKVARSGDQRNVLNNISRSPMANAKLELVLGKQGARELEATLRVEKMMDLQRTNLGNSKTTQFLMDAQLAGGAGGATLLTSNDPTTALTNALIVGSVAGGRRLINQRVANRVAELLVSNDPAVFRRGLQIVAKDDRWMNALRNADYKIARAQTAATPRPNLLGFRGEGEEPQAPPEVR